MSSPTVSIVVPVYNVREYLPRCLDSLISQTLKDIEIIAVDDGSTDGSSAILDSYGAEDARVRVIHVENGGVSIARNIGLDNAEGQYVGFVDSDDYVEPGMFERLVNTIRETEADCVQCSFDIVDGNTRKTEPQETQGALAIEGNGKIVISFFDGRLDNSVWDKLYRRSGIGQNRFPPKMTFAEDFYFNALFFTNCMKAAVVDDVLYHYYVRDCSASHETISDRHLKGFPVYDLVKERLTDEDVVKTVSEKEIAESLRFLDSSIGHKEVSKQSIDDLIRRIRTGRRWIKGNSYMSAGGRLRAGIVCLSPRFYVFVVRVLKKLR